MANVVYFKRWRVISVLLSIVSKARDKPLQADIRLSPAPRVLGWQTLLTLLYMMLIFGRVKLEIL